MSTARLSRIMNAVRTAWSVIGVCLLSLLAVEGAWRLLYWGKDSMIHKRAPAHATSNLPAVQVESALEAQRVVFHWTPYVYFRGSATHGRHVTVQSDGCRRTWQPPPDSSSPPPVEIALFGGSAMWGYGSPDDRTIPSLLARRLAAGNLPARVENRAEQGWVSTQSVLDLLLLLRTGRVPDIVVFYDGVNDMFACLMGGEAGTTLNEVHRVAEFNLLLDPKRLDRAALLGLRGRTAMGRLAHELRHGPPGKTVPQGPGTLGSFAGQTVSDEELEHVAHEVVRVYEHNLKVVCALGDAYGFRPLFYWQPHLLMKTSLTDEERRDLALEGIPREKQEIMQRLFWAVHRDLESSSVLRESRAFHDLGLVFANSPRGLFLDASHVSEEANGLLADEIHRDVRAMLGARDPHGRSAVTASSR